MKISDSDGNNSDYLVELFADTKGEVTPSSVILGLPAGATIEAGSSILTASGEVAFMKSDGTWNWVE